MKTGFVLIRVIRGVFILRHPRSGAPDEHNRFARSKCRTRPGAAAAAHRHHHGRQRPLGPRAGKERVEGHARGAKSVDEVTEECCRLGIGQLTLYCLSSENWKRPKPELDFLMALLKQYLLAEREKILEQNIRFTVIGRREGLARRGAGRDRREHPADAGATPA